MRLRNTFLKVCLLVMMSCMAGCQPVESNSFEDKMEIPNPSQQVDVTTPLNSKESPDDEQILANLVAFTRLFGYVRYFHPSTEARNLDWDQVAYNGINTVLDATNPNDLAQKLQDFFRPCAPALQVYPVTAIPTEPIDYQITVDEDDLRVVMWRHFSISGNTEQSFYHSDLVSARLVNGVVPENFHDPDEPFEAELGGGVAIRMPIALYTDLDGTFPRASQEASLLPDFESEPDDTTRRLAGVVVGWNVLQHFYPYFDVVEADWGEALVQALQGTLEASDEMEYYRVLGRLSSQLHDGHSGISWPDNPNLYSPNIILGWVEESLIVLYVSGSAAQQVASGDLILSIDGKPSAECMAEMQGFLSGATPQWLISKALLYLLLGPEDTNVTLSIVSPAGEESTITLVREINARMIYTPETMYGDRPASISELEPGIMYVDLTRISDGDLVNALPQLEQARGIIFDVRGYPQVSPDSIGYLIEEPVLSPLMAVPEVISPDQQDTVYDFTSWDIQPRSPHLAGEIVFLINGKAISYAETYMSVISNYQLGVIIGTPTAGTNGNVNPFTIPGGYVFNWTGMKVLFQDGSQFHGIGILPDIYVEQTVQGITEGRDEQIEMAVEVINQED